MKTDFALAVSCSTKLRGKTEMEPYFPQCMPQCNKDLKKLIKVLPQILKRCCCYREHCLCDTYI